MSKNYLKWLVVVLLVVIFWLLAIIWTTSTGTERTEKVLRTGKLKETQTTLISNRGKVAKDFYFEQVGGDDLTGSQSITFRIKAEAEAGQLEKVGSAIASLMQNGTGQSSDFNSYRLQKLLLQGVND